MAFWDEEKRKEIEALDSDKLHPPRMQIEVDSPNWLHRHSVTINFEFNLNKNGNYSTLLRYTGKLMELDCWLLQYLDQQREIGAGITLFLSI